MTTFPFQRVLVTGGSGFLGRHVVARLQKFPGIQVFVPRSREYNLIDSAQVRGLLQDTYPDLVIHLAAVVGGIGHNLKNPGRFFYDNVMMSTQLIDESRKFGIRKFVGLGSVCAYPKFTPVPFKEDDLWNGYPEETNAPYGLAKRMMLVQLQAYRQQYDFRGIFLLPANLYGPGDNFDLESGHVIPALIRKCMTAKREGKREIEVWGTGKASREFLYADDCADAIVKSAVDYHEPAPVNVGTGQEIRIAELTQLIMRLTGFAGEVKWQSDKPDGQPRRSLDTSRALAKFGFQASTPLEEGLRRTIAWCQSHLE
jgi:GDP-L-fucose synthase